MDISRTEETELLLIPSSRETCEQISFVTFPLSPRNGMSGNVMMISTGTLSNGEDDGQTMIKVEVLIVKVGLMDDVNKGVEDTAEIMEVRIDVIELDVSNTSDEVSITEVLVVSVVVGTTRKG